MYQVKSNQYIPSRGKVLPNGFRACATYYYITDPNGKIINKDTHKPYKGKNMDLYAIYDNAQAESLCEKLNTKWRILPSLERYPEFKDLVNQLTDEVCKKINKKAIKITSSMLYRQQFVLECIIAELSERV